MLDCSSASRNKIRTSWLGDPAQPRDARHLLVIIRLCLRGCHSKSPDPSMENAGFVAFDRCFPQNQRYTKSDPSAPCRGAPTQHPRRERYACLPPPKRTEPRGPRPSRIKGVSRTESFKLNLSKREVHHSFYLEIDGKLL